MCVFAGMERALDRARRRRFLSLSTIQTVTVREQNWAAASDKGRRAVVRHHSVSPKASHEEVETVPNFPSHFACV